MIGLFRKFTGSQRNAPAIPTGKRAYAVGDIHGRADLLAEALRLIERDEEQRAPADTTIIFLGDLVDRGPQSAEVVECVRTLDNGRRIVTLAGNHEEVLLRILRGRAELIRDWLRFGGAECAGSYGVNVPTLRRAKPERAVEMIRAAIPEAHVRFFESLHDTFKLGDYLFVHAGIRPGIPLAEQAQSDLRWIRGPFLQCSDDHGQVVVGHTISSQPELLGNRIGIDTGAYRSGVLTVLGLEGERQWLLQTGVTEPDRVETVSEQDVAEAQGRC
jgi:serine/threonine protein phosphatase 1